MAASLRLGLSRLLRGSQALLKATRSPHVQSIALPKGIISNGCGMLARFADYSRVSLTPTSQVRSYSCLTPLIMSNSRTAQPPQVLVEQVRTKIRYSLKKGKPKTVHAVPQRFYRLNWGIWIRTRAGRAKSLWKKTPDRKYRLRQHVFCNRTQSKLLNKMVTNFWRRPKYWVDDPYEPYHKRENFDLFFPKRSRPFFP